MLDPEPKANNGGLVQITCTLRFRDGQTVAGTILAPSRYEDCAVVYAGVVERLSFRFAAANSVLLRAFFQSFARELKAQLCEERIGEWQSVEADDDQEGTPDFGKEQELDRL
jgi:hypothetical protein